MKKILFILGLLIIGMNAFAQSSPDKILGKWMSKDKTRVIEFVINGTTYDAIIRKAEDSKLIGKKQITGLIPSGEKSFKNGELHIIQKDATASCKVQLLSDDKLEIKASMGFISKSQVWTRYKEEKQ